MSAQKPSRPLVFGLAALVYFPSIATLVLVGWKFGWRVPAALIAGTALLFAKAKVDVRRKRAGLEPVPWPLAMTAVMAVGATIGGVLVGTEGFVVGLVMGIGLGLPHPTVKNTEGIEVPLDVADPAQQRAISTAALVFTGVMCFFVLALVVGILIERFA